jgi:hypothetical protein
MSAISITLTPGYQFSAGELLSYAKLNLLGQPALQLNGQLGTAQLSNQSVTTPILSDGAVTEGKLAAATFTPDATGAAPFAAGWFSNLAVTQGAMWTQERTRCTVNNNTGVPATKIDIAADELVLKDSNGNLHLATSVALTGVNLLVNGANGLDTGAPAAGWCYFYAIYNPSTVTLAGLISATAPTVAATTGGLSGPMLPSGYTFLALVGAAYYNGTAFQTFRVLNRRVYFPAVQLASAAAMTGFTSYAAFTTGLANAIPPIAKSVRGNFQLSSTYTLLVASDAQGTGADSYLGNVNKGSYDLPVATTQTLYLKASSGSATLNITVNSYEF